MSHTRRKSLIYAAGTALCLPSFSFAQTAGKVRRIGVLATTSNAIAASRVEALKAGLRDRGYVEGVNYVIEFRSAEGNEARLPALAAELVALNVDLIVTNGLGPFAAKRATSTIPIVVTDTGDLVAMGLVESFARPGGNLTGQVFFITELGAKRVELLKEAIPTLSQVGLLYAGSKEMNMRPTPLINAAVRLKMQPVELEVTPSNADFAGAFATMVKRRVPAVAYYDHPTLTIGAAEIAALGLKHRIAVAGGPQVAEAGGLLGYGVRFDAMARSAAVFIDKIFKGAKPGDIPIEQPTVFDFVVNLKTAKALGITLPQPILLQATKVIE